jgi:16S rRNA processing protein RimM
MLVYVRADQIPGLSEGEYYHHECIGMKVFDESGKLVGEIKEILESSAHDIFVVKTVDNQEVLIPATDAVLLNVDVKAHEMRVRLLPGLVPGEEE